MRFFSFVTGTRPSQQASESDAGWWGWIPHLRSLFKAVVAACISICGRAVAPSSLKAVGPPSSSEAAAVPPSRTDDPFDTVASALLHIQQDNSLQALQAASQTDFGQPQVVPVSSGAKPRLFALLIGINKYKHAGPVFSNLNGAVADADDVFEFLTATLGVDPSHIRNLRDQEATRDGIIDAFSALSSDNRIQRGDAIVIFYAGHGSQVAAPSGWEAGGCDAHVEMIIPYNFLPANTSDIGEQGILDFALGKLLSKLADQKGDNIMVIFDSCHSGSSTRNPLQSDVLTRGFNLPEGYAILPSLLEEEGDRHGTIAVGYENSGLASHVLLAACSRTESAKECNGRGIFTQALLALLRNLNVRNVTYRDVVEQLPEWPDQHPQCEGKNSAHLVFDGKAPGRRYVLYPVKVVQPSGQGHVAILGGGEVHGVTEGAEFDILATRDFKARPLCRLIVTTTRACSADLAAKEESVVHDIPQPAWALQATIGKRADFAVAVSPVRDFIEVLKIAVQMDTRPNKRIIQFVDRDQPHQLELQTDGGRAHFLITDTISAAVGVTQFAASVPLDDPAQIYAVVESAADFFFHLHRSNAAIPLGGKVILEAFELKNSATSFEINLTPCTPNLVEDGMVRLNITEDRPLYGFKVVSRWPRDLYVWAFMFDVSDLDVATIYTPNLSKTRPDPSLPGLGSLTLGWGSGGVPPRVFFLRPGINVDVAYLKVFVTTEPVDLSHMAQESPFDGGFRKLKKVPQRPSPVWDTALIAIVQKAVSIIEE